MKKELIIFLLGLTIFSSCSKSGRYLIYDAKGQYRTDSYVVDDSGCITFKSTCECNGTIKMCGSYTIINRSKK